MEPNTQNPTTEPASAGQTPTQPMPTPPVSEPAPTPSPAPTQPSAPEPLPESPSAKTTEPEIDLPKPIEKQIEAPHGKQRSWGKAIGITAVVIILVIAGLYFWGAQLVKNDIPSSSSALNTQ